MIMKIDKVLLAEVENISGKSNSKCGLPLAEEGKKDKTFSKHMARSLGTSVQGSVRSHGLCKVSVFVFPSTTASHVCLVLLIFSPLISLVCCALILSL